MSEPVEKKAPSLWEPVLATLAGLALAADQLWLRYLARHVEVARLLALPPLWFWIPVVLAVLVAGVLGTVGARRPGRERWVRIPLLVLVVEFFVYVFVMPDVRVPDPKSDAKLPLLMAQFVRDGAKEGPMPATVEQLAPVVDSLPPPGLLVRGEPVERWRLVVRSRCTGPDVEGVGVAPATLIYCVSADGTRAWITAVGRSSSSFGAPEVLRWEGAPVVGEVEPEPDAGGP